MKNLKLVLSLVTITLLTNIYSQDLCYTEDYSSNYYSSFNTSINSLTSTGPYNLKIYFHVIRDNDGNGGHNEDMVYRSLCRLNEDFNPHNIYFVWDETINYIDNDLYFTTSTSGIYNEGNHTDGIDVYLFPDSHNTGGGRANGVGESSEFWVSGSYTNPPFQFGNGESITDSKIISHEMGHVLFLWHTFQDCGTNNADNTDGTNCDTTGDLVCDTPADPHLSHNVNSICVWTEEEECAFQEPLANYNPDVNLIMSYTHPNCMTYFTEGQGQRMRNAIESLPHLQNAIIPTQPKNCICKDDQNLIFSGNTLID